VRHKLTNSEATPKNDTWQESDPDSVVTYEIEVLGDNEAYLYYCKRERGDDYTSTSFQLTRKLTHVEVEQRFRNWLLTGEQVGPGVK
jgi:hypothetical protein